VSFKGILTLVCRCGNALVLASSGNSQIWKTELLLTTICSVNMSLHKDVMFQPCKDVQRWQPAQPLTADMSQINILINIAIQPSRTPKKSERFVSEVTEYKIDEGPPASPCMSQPLRIASDPVPALPSLQSTLHVSCTSETEQDGMPNVLVADPTGEHGIALPENPDHLQYEASDTHCEYAS
jgi:hypothetical protein